MKRPIIPSLAVIVLVTPLAACGSSTTLIVDQGDIHILIEEALDEVAAQEQGRGDIGVVDCSSEPSDFDCVVESPGSDPFHSIRVQAHSALGELAEQQGCPVEGVVTGQYIGGEFHLSGIWWDTSLAGAGKGSYHHVERRLGGLFAGDYRNMAGGDGELQGRFHDPGVEHGLFGTFSGEWFPEDFAGVGGELVGLWHPARHREGGVIVGLWSSCSDLSHPIGEPEPAPEPDPEPQPEPSDPVEPSGSAGGGGQSQPDNGSEPCDNGGE